MAGACAVILLAYYSWRNSPASDLSQLLMPSVGARFRMVFPKRRFGCAIPALTLKNLHLVGDQFSNESVAYSSLAGSWRRRGVNTSSKRLRKYNRQFLMQLW